MKMIKKILIYFMMLVVGVSLFGCGLYSDDQTICDKNLKKLISAIESEDHNAIKSLFASNKIDSIEGIDENIDELLDYFEGDYVSMRGGPGGTESTKNDDIIIKRHYMYYDIQTSACTYKVSIEWCVEYTKNAGNVGIWSLNINKLENLEPRSGFVGDLLFTRGIHIDLPYLSDVLYQLIDAIDEQNREGIKALFAPNILSNIEDIDESIENLFVYYNDVENARFSNSGAIRLGTYRENIYYKMSFDIFDELGIPMYRVAAEWHFADSADSDNIGLWSFSILKYEETDNLLENYWGDGNFTPGIQVAVPKTADSPN